MENSTNTKHQTPYSVPRRHKLNQEMYDQMQVELKKSEEEIKKLKWIAESHEEIIDYLFNLQLVFPQPYYEKLKTQQLLPLHDWAFVLQVNYKTFEGLKCPICLVDYFEMTSPHMAFCGHIYCLPCILRHLMSNSKCPLCKDEILKSLLKFTRFDLTPKLKPSASIVFMLVKKNEETKRFESQCETNNKMEMLTCLNIDQQQDIVGKQMEVLLQFQEENQDVVKDDPLFGKAIEEGINYVVNHGEAYFDAKSIDEYFCSASQRKKQRASSIFEGGLLSGGMETSFTQLKRKQSKSKPAKEVFFYQELGGSNTFLHYICQEYLEKTVEVDYPLPKSIKVLAC